MVMPLGPDLAVALGIASSDIGLIGASYTIAAAGSALLAVAWLDRFDRRTVVMVCMLGLAVGTAAAALATDTRTLIAARFLAGIFGGPATSVAMAMIIDGVAPERRGRALGAVMGAFSAASVLGVPVALELAHWGSWRTPFVAVALLGLTVAITVRLLLPMMREHLSAFQKRPTWEFLNLFTRQKTLTAYCATGLALFAGFLIIPNLSAWVQFNQGYPREYLGVLYLVGGIASFIVMRAAGHLVDHYGSIPVAWAGTALLLSCLLFGFIWQPFAVPVMLMFVTFMVAMSTRNVATTTLLTHVPDAHERAGFMSANSAVQNFGAASGAALSSVLLGTSANGALLGMTPVALLAMTSALTLPFLLKRIRYAPVRA